MDYYLNQENAVDRLLTEWLAYGKIIVAYDYDDTVYDFHKKGRTYHNVMNLLKDCRKYAHFVVFTACNETQYDSIREYLKENDLPCDKINDNLDFIPFTGRKIYYNILLDDRAGLDSAYQILSKALHKYKKIKERI